MTTQFSGPMPHSYHCPCGWSRIILEGETLEDARRAHEKADIHAIALREQSREECDHARIVPDDDGQMQRFWVCLDCDSEVVPGERDEDGEWVWELMQ